MESPIIANLPRGYRMDRQFGVVYDTPITPSSDLTRIDGIRTREAVLLNQLGVYYFGQLALWRHREMQAIAGELQIPLARIVDEAWTEQARTLCAAPPVEPVADLPSTILRTVSLLACALLIGFFAVYLLTRQRNEPLTGVLSADITTIKVPAESRLTEVLIKPGQEVFSGQPLLTLEKLEHLQLIQKQETLVRDLQRELKQAEAQAAMELEWRLRDVDRELSSVLQHLTSQEPQPALNDPLPLRTPIRAVRTVSAARTLAENPAPPKSGGLLFFGAGGQSPVADSSQNTAAESAPVPPPQDLRVAEAPRRDIASDSPISMAPLSTNTADTSIVPMAALETEHRHLQELRSSLPQTVNEALGVASLRARYADAARELEAMKAVSREVTVSSPVYGVVGQVRYQQGDQMTSGEVLLRILHTDRRYIIVHLPTRRVHEMRAGNEVELIFPGHELYRGVISDVPVLAEDSNSTGETLARVRVDPVGRLWPSVPVGSQVDVVSLR